MKEFMIMDQSYSFLSKKLADIDPDTHRLIAYETRRQERKIILIASESICPQATLEAQASVFSNIYAEGYPSLRMSQREQKQMLNVSRFLAFHRRYGDRRHYKGCDYVNFVESLAQWRAAQLFAPKDPSLKLKPEDLFVNVQALSGAAANNSVYQALVQPGDVVMGLALPHGGHLTHGSEFNRSGKLYQIIHYEINSQTGHIDYEKLREQAHQNHPKMIIAGASAYPWDIDWKLLRTIADEVGAYLFADIAHPSGLVATGLFSNPVGYAHVTTMTTHKTLCGPRGAIIITTNEALARKIDNAVFPGEQGGPHINTIAGLAVTFKLAGEEEYRNLMKHVVENAQALVASLQKRGLEIVYGGTTTHLCLVNLSKIQTKSGIPLKGDVASDILDVCGITCNKNTIPGDITSADSSAVRFGTTWITQLGMGPNEMDTLAGLIAKVLLNIQTFTVETAGGIRGRGRISQQILNEVRQGVFELLNKECHPSYPTYPHYYHTSKNACSRDIPFLKQPEQQTAVRHGMTLVLHSGRLEVERQAALSHAVMVNTLENGVLEICGERAENFLTQILTANIRQLAIGTGCRSFILADDGKNLGDVHVFRMPSFEDGYPRFYLIANAEEREDIKAWLRDLSDGYVYFDSRCIYTKIDGPVVVTDLNESIPCLISWQLVGPQAKEIIAKLQPSLADLAVWHIQEITFENAKMNIAHVEYGENSNVYEFYLEPTHLPALIHKVREIAGSQIHITGQAILDSLRESADLPLPGNKALAKDLIAKLPKYFDPAKSYFIGQYTVVESLPKNTKHAHEFKCYDGEARRTCLYEEHLKISNRGLVPFAGWQMPILYTSILDEHTAVRTKAGLFDVSHMGAVEIAGPGATRFLDLIASNFISRMRIGQSQYSYLVDPSGKIIDDIMVYCRGVEKYMVIINASNAEKDFAWMQAVLARKVIIDYEFPNAEIDVTPILRDLKDPSAGRDCKVDVALQGPMSLKILCDLIGNNCDLKKAVSKLAKATFIEAEVAEMPILISRSGYTGEDWGFELYLHPEHAPRLWNLLLEKGKPYGIQPTGLGARDSTRTEAGFPLYGHELAGPCDITPHEAGYGSFVKYHKPFFIGKLPLLKKDLESKNCIVRFQVDEVGVRAIRPGAIVLNRKGQMIGSVTSCAFTGSLQIGMAHIDQRYSQLGSKFELFMLPGGKKVSHKGISDLKVGDSFPLPESATVISRFPMRTAQKPID